jgi:Cys-tRNA(Pro)/Cys-tRNA(Cys) deacylase
MNIDSMAPGDIPSAASLLAASGIAFEVHWHAEVRTSDDIRTRTGFTEDNVARSIKTMAFAVDPDRVILASIPGPARLQYGQLAAALSVRRSALRLADAAILAQLNMAPGGITPVCSDPRVTVVFDSSIPGMGRVLLGSGRPDCTIEAHAQEIAQIAPNLLIADIASLR